MPYTNVTIITEFFLMGFPGLPPWCHGPVAGLFLIVYLTIVSGNGFLLVFVGSERHLQKPSYLIFCNLAMSDIVFATTTLPKAIARYWAEDQIITFNACFLQMFLVHTMGSFNSFLLMIMALDRYVAICNPLRYHTLIKNSSILTLCCLAWLISTSWMIFILVQAYSLTYCNSNKIFQCYCDHFGLTTVACDNNWKIQVIAFAGAMTVLLGPLTFILFSYISIIIAVMKVANLEGRYKAFSTCSPQLCIICLYYVPRCFNYVVSIFGFNLSADIRIVMILLYSLFPPVVNPLVYCFKTTEIKETLSKRFKSIKTGVAGCNS
ncbi:olfactory receptor 2AT4-like [Scleropages formosus]|uniref:olfactory receptor 2AT4-like n=1 Tax=Scleropages formosus TaxID=113540 RepID=UPI0008788DE7|nr:olfactory receptor 2AT4-like [Scleropages formosus]